MPVCVVTRELSVKAKLNETWSKTLSTRLGKRTFVTLNFSNPVKIIK